MASSKALSELFGEAQQGSVPVGAVDAPPGSKLYELMQRQGGRQRPRQAAPQQRSPEAFMRDQERRANVLAGLMEKATTGMEQPGEGMVPFGQMPRGVRQLLGNRPVVGWDPKALTPEERLMLSQLQGIGQREFAQQNPDAIVAETAPAPGMPGAPNVRRPM